MWSKQMADFLPLDLQLGFYLTAMAHHPRAKPPLGAYYNLLRRPSERRGITENLGALALRIGKKIDKDPDHFFQRLRITFTDREREEHLFRAQKLVEEFYEWWKQDHSTRDLLWNSGQCESKYGTCSMLPICAHRDRSAHHIREQASPELAAE